MALVTGAANGIGEAAARALARAGASVVVADITERGRLVAEEVGGAALYVRLDVTSRDDWLEAITLAEKTFGPVGVLVNNAGVISDQPLAEVSEAEFNRVVAVNQYGVLLGMQQIVETMRRAGEGSIVNIASTAAMRGVPGSIVYAATKWAVRGMTLSAAGELAPLGIRVNCIFPGVISGTVMHSHETPERVETMRRFIPMQRLGTPEEIADAVVFLAGPGSRYMTGAELAVNGGITA